MIMDNVKVVKETSEMKEEISKKEATEAAIDNKKMMEMIQRYKTAHTPLVHETQKIGRNDPCPCGSGKKYKNCCLESGRYEKLVLRKKAN